jgi:ubiquinone/menaquinone biosynthesis C-methylase UbiE
MVLQQIWRVRSVWRTTTPVVVRKCAVPKNLSVSAAETAVGDFYPAIHRRMTEHGPNRRRPRPTVAEFIDLLEHTPAQHRRSALDVGCGGTAALTLACAEHGFRAVFGLDLSDANLKQAGAITAGRQRIHFCRGSATTLPFPDASFDFVICSGVVHHTPDPERCIRELARVLKSEGRLYLSVYCFSGSAFEWLVRTLRHAGRAVSFEILHRTIGRYASINNFLLDHMYVPLLWLFRAEEVRALLHREGLTTEQEFTSRMDPFRRLGGAGQWLTGDGLMRVWLCAKR